MPPRTSRQRTANTEEQLRCFCSSHKCGSEYDPITGLYGAMVNPRQYRQHQADDKTAEVYHRAEKARLDALTAHEEMVVHALDTMTLGTQTATSFKEGRYRMDGIKKTIAQISEVKDSIAALELKFHAIGSAPANRVSTQAVKNALAQFSEILEEATQQYRQLSMSGRGAYRKVDAVKTLYHETKEEYKVFIQGFKSYESSWKAAEMQRKAEHEAFLTSGGTEFDSSSHFVNVFEGVKAILQIVILMVVACSVVLGLPRRGSSWLFSMSEFVIQTTVAKIYGLSNFPPYFSHLLRGFPRDIRTAAMHFQIDGKSTVLAACPKCHATYAPELVEGILKYQERCNFLIYGSPCKELLVRPKRVRQHQISVPIKPYISFDMKDWMADLLSRRGNEEKMDAAWEQMEVPSDGVLRDIFQGSVVRELKGPDRKTPFSRSGNENAGRYLFSLGADFFNPLRNLTAGKKISIGIIALVCLNLPIEQRYLPENMFLAGIIPGPHEPSLSAVNHYLQPLIDVLLLFWSGILFSKTALYPEGRLILCALIAVVCDLPAARKFGGFAGHNHEFFCSMCWCNKTQHTFNDYDYLSWKRRTNQECRAYADSFRTATTAKDASSSFDRSGVRWSELLRLPYFDPAKMLVVDPMHNLFLGLVKEHFQNILGYRPKTKDWLATNDNPSHRLHIPPTSNNPLPPGKNERASIRRLTSFLAAPPSLTPENTFDELVTKLGGPKSTIHLSAFIYVARGLDCIASTVDFTGRDNSLPNPAPALKKKELAHMVLSRQKGQGREDEKTLDEIRGRIFTEKEMEELWGDLERVIKPSWVSSVPSTIASICPKLKSDQWRTIGSLYLPVTLVRLWSESNIQDEHHEKRRQLLHLTMLLCSAISVATSRITSEAHAKQFLAHMMEYRQELNRLFPAYECHPNHHITFHITELLPMYGPVHGWWTFPFERMIGMLQRIRTNYKEGEYEATIARSWTRSSNFRAFFSKATCPQPITMCYDMFMTLVRPQTRNSLSLSPAIDEDDSLDSEDIDSDTEPVLEDPIASDIRAAFVRVLPEGVIVPMKGKFLNHLICKGITYATRTIHAGNSSVLQKFSDVPFSIENIINFPVVGNGAAVEGPWLVVRRYKAVKIEEDPYLRYPLLRAKMWATELEPVFEVFPVSNVAGQFAKCVIRWREQEVAVVVSLSRMQGIEA